MSYAILAAIVWLSVFALVNVAASTLVVLVWPLLRERTAGWRPSRRSAAALVARLFPAATAVACVATVGVIFVAFEPGNTDERAGIVLMGVAALGAALLLAGSTRAAIALWSTRRLLREWETGATPLRLRGSLPAWQIETGFPVVAVVGVLSPRLLVARTVVEACHGQGAGGDRSARSRSRPRRGQRVASGHRRDARHARLDEDGARNRPGLARQSRRSRRRCGGGRDSSAGARQRPCDGGAARARCSGQSRRRERVLSRRRDRAPRAPAPRAIVADARDAARRADGPCGCGVWTGRQRAVLIGASDAAYSFYQLIELAVNGLP